MKLIKLTFVLLASLTELYNQQALFYSSFSSTTISSVEPWNVINAHSTSYITHCNGVDIIGGYNSFAHQSAVTYFGDLTPHYRIKISINVYLIDSWDGESFQIYVDHNLSYSKQYSLSGTQNLCGAGWMDSSETIEFEIDHNFRNIFILVTSTLDQGPNDESWGFRDFKIYLFECPLGCQLCSNSDSFEDCQIWNQAQSLQTQLDITNFYVDGWTITGGSQSKQACSEIPLICGPQVCGKNTIIQTKIILPEHYQIQIQFRYISIDNWNTGDKAILNIDGETIWTQEFTSLTQYSNSLCGGNIKDSIVNSVSTLSHSFYEINIEISNNLIDSFTIQSFGFRDFEIFTSMNKIQSSSGIPIVCGDKLIQGSEYCDDGNLEPFDGCFSCQFSCSDGCLDCLFGTCINCYPDWLQDFDNNQCIYIQRNWIYQYYDIECQDNNIEPFDGCFNNQYSCVYGCKECIKGICLYCEDGFEFNSFNNECEPICGDQQIKLFEQCDSNLKECNNCKLQCSEFCSYCEQGICFVCQEGYFLRENYSCELIFSIEIFIPPCNINCMQCVNGLCLECQSDEQSILEKCEEIPKNNLSELFQIEQVIYDNLFELSIEYQKYQCSNNCQTCFNGICLECQQDYINILGSCFEICGDSYFALNTFYECLCDSQCSECKYGICYQCNDEYNLLNNNCLSICGNQIIQEYEDCDDGNDAEYDGCYNCQYSCPEGCIDCIQGQCYDQCKYGYYLLNSKCETICGDQIVAGNEQCDDGNSVKSDGCFNCQFYCPNQCKECFQGICSECLQGLTLQNNQCINICGDGIPFIPEECDDGNLNDGDGCSKNCIVEQDWVCQQGMYCFFVQYPKMIAKLENTDNSIQIVSITFTQQVYKNSNISFVKCIQATIENLDETLYNITTTAVKEAQFELVAEVEYQIEIEFYTSLESEPTLIIILQESLYDEFETPLYSNTAKVKLKKPNYISEAQKKVAGSLQSANESSVKSIFALSFLLVIFGDALSVVGILEIMQEQSYLRFINVQYPQTILIYFESSNLVSLNVIFDFLQMSPYLDNIQDNLQAQESIGKFQYYQINSNILSNVLGELIIFLTLLATLLCTSIILKIIIKIQKAKFLQNNPKLIRKIQKVQTLIQKIQVKIQQKGVEQTFLASSWDLILISQLQIYFYIHNYAEQNSEQINNLQTYIGLVTSFCILGIGFFMISKYIKSISFTKKNNLYKFWQKKGELFKFLKKFLILYVLVFFQNHQEHQTLLLTVINLCYIIYVFYFRPSKKLQDHIKLLAMEISKFLFFASTFTYWDVLSNYFLQKEKIMISWIQISVLLSTIAAQVLIEFYNLAILIIQRIKKYRLNKLIASLKPTITISTPQADPNNLFTFKAQSNINETEESKVIFQRPKFLSNH